jgi:methionine aminopeptidase
MSITIKTNEEIAIMREAGKIVADTHELLESMIKPQKNSLEVKTPFHLLKITMDIQLISVLLLMKKLCMVFLARKEF